jgi:hypothetical protein
MGGFIERTVLFRAMPSHAVLSQNAALSEHCSLKCCHFDAERSGGGETCFKGSNSRFLVAPLLGMTSWKDKE